MISSNERDFITLDQIFAESKLLDIGLVFSFTNFHDGVRARDSFLKEKMAPVQKNTVIFLAYLQEDKRFFQRRKIAWRRRRLEMATTSRAGSIFDNNNLNSEKVSMENFELLRVLGKGGME